MDARLNGRRRIAGLVAIFCSTLTLPAFAQTDTGGIEGVVRDSSGAVLPVSICQSFNDDGAEGEHGQSEAKPQ